MIENITDEFLRLIKLPDENSERLNYLVVMPRTVADEDSQYQFPLGICYISSSLKASGRNVYTLNLNYKPDCAQALRKAILSNNIDVVATGGLSGQYRDIREITDIAKSVKPGIVVLVGGGIITAEPVVAMKALEIADYGIIGEGEITVNALAYALENGNDPTLLDGVIANGNTEYNIAPDIADIDILPFPDYEGFELKEMLGRKYLSIFYDREPQYTRSASVLCSRSCPYQCTFCFHTSGRKYRRRSLDVIFKEINWLIDEYQINYLVINDEMFVGYTDELFEFCSRIKPYGIKWWGQTRVDVVTKDILQVMKDSGCSHITFGVESGDNTILKSMRKNVTVEQIEKAFNLTKEVGLSASGNIILGDLEETKETYRNSMKWWAQHRDYDLILRYLWVFPGSFLYAEAIRKGVISDPIQFLRDGCPQINITKMSDDEYQSMLNEVEIFKLIHDDKIMEEIDLSILKARLEGLLSDKIALWPATTPLVSLLNSIAPNFISSPNVYFINRSATHASVSGISAYGKMLYKPDIIAEKNISTVIVIYRMSIYRMIADDIKENGLPVTRVVHVSELLKREEYG